MLHLHYLTLFVFASRMTSSACTGKSEQERQVMLPVKAGEDVGVVIVAGAYLFFDQYQALGSTARVFGMIQSNFEVLTVNYFL